MKNNNRLMMWGLIVMFISFIAGCGGAEVGSQGGGSVTSSASPSASPSTLLVKSTAPANASVGASTHEKVAVQFNNDMDASTINTTTISLKESDGTSVAGTISYDSTSHTVTLTPATNLKENMTFHVKVTTAAKSTEGISLASDFDSIFTTGTSEVIVKPTVSSVTPQNNEINVSTHDKVAIQFNTEMDASMINTTNILITGPNGVTVTGTVSYDSTTHTATFVPSNQLTANTTYHLKVTTDVKSAAQASLAGNFESNFTTSEAASPSVSTTSPINNTTNVSLNEHISVQFNEAMDASTINTANILITGPNGATIAGTISYNDTTHVALFTPASSLTANTSYHVTVTTGVKNAAQVFLTSNFQSAFTTANL